MNTPALPGAKVIKKLEMDKYHKELTVKSSMEKGEDYGGIFGERGAGKFTGCTFK